MKPKKQGAFVTFILSLIPGAAETYMGMFKNGISIMGSFIICVLLIILLDTEDALSFVCILAWLYSFVHARSIASRDSETISQIEDVYVWDELIVSRANDDTQKKSVKKYVGIALLVIAIVALTKKVCHVICTFGVCDKLMCIVDVIPAVVLSIAMLVLGISLIRKKRNNILN